MWKHALDRLLASDAFAERWAAWWLDLARYADSQGYEKDALRRSMWRYRDWVIDAFRRDMPFDQFTIEQLAGDLLPDPTVDQQVATAFHRQTMTNSEGGTDDEEDEWEAHELSISLVKPKAPPRDVPLVIRMVPPNSFGLAVGKSASAAAAQERSANKNRRGGRLGTLTVAACAAADW